MSTLFVCLYGLAFLCQTFSVGVDVAKACRGEWPTKHAVAIVLSGAIAMSALCAAFAIQLVKP
jgi:hypothetical protein